MDTIQFYAEDHGLLLEQHDDKIKLQIYVDWKIKNNGYFVGVWKGSANSPKSSL